MQSHIGTVASLTLHVAFARDHMGGWRACVLVTPRQGAGVEGAMMMNPIASFIDLHSGAGTVFLGKWKTPHLDRYMI